MTKDELADTCLRALYIINDIIEIYEDKAKYKTKEDVYDTVEKLLIEKKVIEKCNIH